MRNAKRAGAALLAAGVLVGALRMVRARSAPAQAAAPVKIAVVNLPKLFNQLDEKHHDDSAIKKMERGFQKKELAKVKAIKKMRRALNPSSPTAYKEGSTRFRKKQNELMHASLAFRLYQQYTQQRLGSRDELDTEKIYRDIDQAIARYSKKHGISLVLMKETSNFASTTPQQLELDIKLREVLYAARRIDITDRIRDRMNAAFRRANGH